MCRNVSPAPKDFDRRADERKVRWSFTSMTLSDS